MSPEKIIYEENSKILSDLNILKPENVMLDGILKGVRYLRLDEVLAPNQSLTLVNNRGLEKKVIWGISYKGEQTYVFEGTKKRALIFDGYKIKNNSETNKEKEHQGIIEEAKSRLQIPKKIEKTRRDVEKILNLGEYIKIFENYKGKINGPNTLKIACNKLGINAEDLQGVLGVKVDGNIGKKTYRAFKSKIIDKLKYSHYGENFEIRQNKNELKKSRERIKEIESGKKLSDLAERYWQRGKVKGKCGKGVGNNLNKIIEKGFGISKAMKITSGRDGYKWTSFLENPKNWDPRIQIIKTPIDFPKQAPVGSILVYDGEGDENDSYIGSSAKRDNGHVEFVSSSGYFYDGRANNPGGSSWRVKQTGTPEEYAKKTGFTGYAYQLNIVA